MSVAFCAMFSTLCNHSIRHVIVGININFSFSFRSASKLKLFKLFLSNYLTGNTFNDTETFERVSSTEVWSHCSVFESLMLIMVAKIQ